jgi:hypothetical protein
MESRAPAPIRATARPSSRTSISPLNRRSIRRPLSSVTMCVDSLRCSRCAPASPPVAATAATAAIPIHRFSAMILSPRSKW